MKYNFTLLYKRTWLSITFMLSHIYTFCQEGSPTPQDAPNGFGDRSGPPPPPPVPIDDYINALIIIALIVAFLFYKKKSDFKSSDNLN